MKPEAPSCLDFRFHFAVMSEVKYRRSISRSGKKRKVGRKSKETSIDVEVESFSTTATLTADQEEQHDEQSTSTCSKKLKLDHQNLPLGLFYVWCYLLIDTRIFQEIIDLIGRCPECSSKVNFVHDVESKKGLSHLLNLSCLCCDWTKIFWTSCEVEKPKDARESRGRSSFDINTRIIIAFREIGKGFTAIKTFCGFMNIPPPMTQKSFADIQDNNIISYKQAAEDNMKNAAAELQDGTDEIINTAISTDGTWQRRGFSSLNGVVTVINNSTGKCIDYRVKTKNCHACKLWKNKTGPKAEKFRKNHKCLLNHTGASGMMESDGILDCFKSSVATRKLRYLTYIGDGDTKSYTNVVTANPYPGYTIKKSECVGHVQKRCGKKLLQFKSTCKDMMPKEYYDDKKDKKQKKFSFYLTHKNINTLQNYYGIAIRSNSNTSINEMRKAIGAVLYHCSDATDLASRHQFCPVSAGSWCKYKVDQVMGTSKYIEKPGLPIPLRKKLESIFRELSSPELLAKCLEGSTQNNNESLNGVIWTRCPKNVLVGLPVLEMSVSSAILTFNSGKRGIFDVFTNCGLEIGSFTNKFCYKEDAHKVFKANIKSMKVTKKRRKSLRAIRKGFVDKEAEGEPSYSSGTY